MEHLKNVIENIKIFKQENSLLQLTIKDKFTYAPLTKFKGVKYGFAVFSEEEYEPHIKSLNKCQYKHRYYYYEQFDEKNNKEVIFVMFNPSSACPDKDDPTIKNCRKLAKKQYGSMEIINILSERNPKVKDIQNIDNTTNYNFIKELLAQRKSVDVIIAWGYGKEKEYKLQIEMVEKLLSNNKKYKITVKATALKKIKNYDRHPAPTAWSIFGGFEIAAELTEYQHTKHSKTASELDRVRN